MWRGLDFFCEKFFMRANKPPCSQRNFRNLLDSIKLNQFVCKSKFGGGEGGKDCVKSFFRYYQGKFSLYQYQWEGWLKMTAFRSRTACHITLETLERWPHGHHQFFCWIVQHILWTWAYLLTTKVITNYFKCAYKYNVKIKVSSESSFWSTL